MDTPALVHGREVHARIEAIAKGLPPPPKTTQAKTKRADEITEDNIAFYGRALRSLPGLEVELDLAVDADLAQCDFTDTAGLCRARLDILYRHRTDPRVAFILDWKTGRPWSRSTELQGLVCAALLFMTRPRLEHIEVKFVYLETERADPGHIKPYPFRNRSATIESFHNFNTMIQKAVEEGETAFVPKKGFQCNYCSATSAQCSNAVR